MHIRENAHVVGGRGKITAAAVQPLPVLNNITAWSEHCDVTPENKAQLLSLHYLYLFHKEPVIPSKYLHKYILILIVFDCPAIRANLHFEQSKQDEENMSQADKRLCLNFLI